MLCSPIEIRMPVAALLKKRDPHRSKSSCRKSCNSYSVKVRQAASLLMTYASIQEASQIATQIESVNASNRLAACGTLCGKTRFCLGEFTHSVIQCLRFQHGHHRSSLDSLWPGQILARRHF